PRSSEPSGFRISLPNSFTTVSNPCVPGATTSPAIASASIVRAPSSRRTSSTNDLPTAIDPVRPTFIIGSQYHLQQRVGHLHASSPLRRLQSIFHQHCHGQQTHATRN